MSLKYFFKIEWRANITWRKWVDILKEINCLSAESCQLNLQEYLHGSKDIFDCDRRGGQQNNSFYEVYPVLEIIANEFVASECTKKKSSFIVLELANFINQKFFEMNGLELQNKKLIQCEESCRKDLEKWGVKFNLLSKRLYFKGRERIDVICYRSQFFQHFVSIASNYYLLT